MQRLFSEAEQGTQEWLDSRIGYVTASNMAKVMAGGRGATRKSYMVKMLSEILSGRVSNGYKSIHMQNGNDNEPTARLAYELATGNSVEEKGFCYVPELKLGASTDGVVGDEGLIEIKNVLPATQVEFFITEKIKTEYIKQMQTQMFVLNKQWVDFVSQSLGDEDNGELPEKYKLKIVRVYRDEDMIQKILQATRTFHEELNDLIAQLEQKVG